MTPLGIILGISLSAGSSLSDLCKVCHTSPENNVLSLGVNGYGVRGVFTDEPIDADTTVLAIPLEACLRDDQAPAQSDQWAIRLASSLLELQHSSDDRTLAQQTWLDMLPDANTLRDSLPVHWDDESSACPSSMAMALDSMYFVRADAVAQLQEKFPAVSSRACHDALDVVQTRSCRVEPGIRLLAPIFDLLNHGGDSANAEFIRKDDALLVKSVAKIDAGAEILIDYGDSTRPAWKCLLSYGFVPADNDLGEMVVDNVRYTVGPESIPYEMVEAVCTKLCQEEVSLTKEVCTHLADHAEHTARQGDDDEPTLIHPLLSNLIQSERQALRAFARGLREFHA